MEVWDVSCRYAPMAAALEVLLFRPKIVQNPINHLQLEELLSVDIEAEQHHRQLV